GVGLGIDRLLFRDSGAIHTSSPGRMSPNTAAAYLVIGAALALLDRRPARLTAARALALVAAGIGLVGIVGYAVDAPSFLTVGSLTRISPAATVAFVLLGLGTFVLYPERGAPAVLTGDGPGAAMARHLLPVAILGPPIIALAISSAEA